jgi:hypothetical protein
MEAGGQSSSRQRLLAHSVAASALILTVALRVWPALATLLPVCPIHAYLGVLCPGCGATHALLMLLRGHLLGAAHANALFVFLLPAALWFAGECYRRAVSMREFEWPRIPAAAVYSLLAAGFVFGLFRNVA